MGGTSSSRRRRRLWKFGNAEFDEAIWALRVDGLTIPLEAKPLELLHELLLRAGEVVTKDEILDAVWPGVTVVEGSLPTAISKLRKALGERQDSIIETVPRVGYRLACPVTVESVESPLAPRFAFVAGDAVPGRRQWRMVAPLGDASAGDVWLAQHEKTGEQRVFKFADDPGRLRALKREAALSRVVFAAMGIQAPLPALLEWNFEAPPYALEYAYGGPDLIAWAKQAGGLAAIPVERRLAVAAQIARAVAAIHRLGVLHKDLKPANILVFDDGSTQHVRLADFGSGRLVDDTVLERFQITDPGSLEQDLGKDEPRSGTLAYRAPELVGDAMPTTGSDIYALGLILYQLVAGDFTKALAPGWEAKINDPLLREDIGLAAALDPEQRLASGDLLADRIERLAERRVEAEADAEQAARIAGALRREQERLARRPWVRAAIGSLAAGFVLVSVLAVLAWSQRNAAVAARQKAETGYRFIAEDILSSPDPAQSAADETLAGAMKRASANIDNRFASDPGSAARLHLALGRAFHQRGDLDTARAEYDLAGVHFAKGGEGQSDDAVVARLSKVHLDATSGQPDRLAAAGKQLTHERERLGKRGEAGPVGFALAQAEGAHGYFTDIEQAERAFRRAARIGSSPGSGVPESQVLKIRSSLVMTLLRLGRPEEAEPLARRIIADSVRIRGEEHPDTLVTRQHWLTSLSFLGRHDDVISKSAPLLSTTEARFGPDHRMTLTLRSTRFESLSATGRYDEAAKEAERVWQGASSQSGESSHQALTGQTDYASVLCQTPRKSEALRIIADARQRVETAFGTDYPFTHVVRYFSGECQLANGRIAEAERTLLSIDRKMLIDISGRPEMGAMVDLGLAEIALQQGRKVQAIGLYQKLRPELEATKDKLLRTRLSRLASLIG